MVASTIGALILAGAAAATPKAPGMYHGTDAICSLEKPEISTRFNHQPRVAEQPSFVLVLSKAAVDFGIDEKSLQLIHRKLGGIFLIGVEIEVTAREGSEGVFDVRPTGKLLRDTYAFAIKKEGDRKSVV